MVDAARRRAAPPARWPRSGSRSSWPTSSASSTCSPTTRRRSATSSRSRPTRSGLPDSPGEVLASMGNYVFDADALVEAVTRDATEIGSKHDMGGDIVPSFVRRAAGRRLRLQGQRRARARPTATAATGATSGRSAPTTPRTWTSSRRCRSSTSTTSTGRSTPPTARSRRPSWCRAPTAARPRVDEAVLSPGVVVSGGTRAQARCSRPAVSVGAGAEVDRLGADERRPRSARGAVVRNAILDKNVVVPPGAEIGVDPDADRARGFVVEDGLTVLGKDQAVPRRLTRLGSRRRPARRRRTPRPASATVSWALSPLGLGTTHSSAPAERLRLPAERRPSRRPKAVRYAVMPAIATTRGPDALDERDELARRRRAAPRRRARRRARWRGARRW